MSRVKVSGDDNTPKQAVISRLSCDALDLFILVMMLAKVFYLLHEPVKWWSKQKCDQHE
jgi:hypothetical protein